MNIYWPGLSSKERESFIQFLADEMKTVVEKNAVAKATELYELLIEPRGAPNRNIMFSGDSLEINYKIKVQFGE